MTTRRHTVNWLCATSWIILLAGALNWVNVLFIDKAPNGFRMPPSWWMAANGLYCDVMNPFVLTVVFIITLALTADVAVSVYGPADAVPDDDQHAAEAMRGS